MAWITSAIFAALVAVSCIAQEPPDEPTAFSGPIKVGAVNPRKIAEASGIAASISNPGVLWLINDSGDDANVYAINTKGEILCTLFLKGARNVDFEDLAISKSTVDGRAYIYVADIGDNNGVRSSVVIHKLEEPVIDQPQIVAVARAFEFTYPDKARDAEALFVDPLTDEVYLISKREKHNTVYLCPIGENNQSASTLKPIAMLPFGITTAADMSANGLELIVKNYVHAYHWQRKATESIQQMLAKPPTHIPYMPEPQGEAMCFSASNTGYYTISEAQNDSSDVEVVFYGRSASASEAQKIRDLARPQISVEPSGETRGMFNLRYNVPKFSPVRMYLYNAIMLKIEDIETEVSESGVQERTLDMREKPAGTYVVMLFASGSYNAVPVVVEDP